MCVSTVSTLCQALIFATWSTCEFMTGDLHWRTVSVYINNKLGKVNLNIASTQPGESRNSTTVLVIPVLHSVPSVGTAVLILQVIIRDLFVT